jgi:N-acetyl-alpha-D-muramate 1-phosphate uridylyltransferase
MQAVIVCGGKGTRLGELTKDTPKSLIEVAGRPFIDWQLERLRKCGFQDSEAVVCVGHLSGQITEHLQHTDILVVDEGDRCLGTGGALRLALPHLQEKFLVTYGDSYLTADLAEPMRVLVSNQDCDAVMSVWNEEPGNVVATTVDSGDWVVDIGDGFRQPLPYFSWRYTDYGATAMTRKIVEGIPSGLSISLNSVLGGYARAGSVRAWMAPERYHEIGSPEGLAECDAFLRGQS